MSLQKVFTLTFVLILMLCSAAYAVEFTPRGSVVIPGIQSSRPSSTNFSQVYLHVTNVAGCDVDCRVTVYDHAGNDVTSYASVYEGSDTGPTAVLAASGGDFSLPSGASRFVRIAVDDASKLLVGHAVVEWASTNTHVKKALVVSGRYYSFYKDGLSYSALPIISGQPF